MKTYPYKVKNTLARESKGRIILDLSEYKYTREDAMAAEKRHYKKQLT